MAHVWITLQALNLWRIHNKYPGLILESWMGKLALIANAWAVSKGAANLLMALKSPQEFAQGLSEQGIQPRAGVTSGKWGVLLGFVPAFWLARRGKGIKVERHVRYADLKKVDVRLSEMWEHTPSKLKNAHMLLGRGRISQWCSLDVWKLDPVPAHEWKDGMPVLIYIHGGGWLLGDKMFSAYATLNRLASRGIVICVINYRMSPEAAWPAHILDCKRALIFIKKNALKWGGDPKKVFVSGESAGGHLSALIGMSSNVPEFQPPEEDPNADTSVQGALPIYGVYDLADTHGDLKSIHASILDLSVGIRPFFSRMIMQKLFAESRDEFNLASPMFHVRKYAEAEEDPKVCPFFISHGTCDALASYADAKRFYEELQAVRKKFGTWATGESDVFVTVNGGHHAYGYATGVRSNALADGMYDFMAHHSRRYDAAKPAKSAKM